MLCNCYLKKFVARFLSAIAITALISFLSVFAVCRFLGCSIENLDYVTFIILLKICIVGALAQIFISKRFYDAVSSAASSKVECKRSLEQRTKSLISQNQKLRHEAFRDLGTGLKTKTSFVDLLTKEWKRLKRNRKPLGILICEISGKKSNDSDSLQQLADYVQSSVLRASDEICRYDESSVICLLPETDSSGVRVVMQRIQERYKNNDDDLQILFGASSTVFAEGFAPAESVKLAEQSLEEQRKRNIQ